MYEVDIPIVDITPEVEVEVSSDDPIETETDLVIDDGVKDYNDLLNKPRIESVELVGDKSFDDLNLNKISNSEIEELLSLSF